jgi:O-antigen/teichoic acid export membrane protein
MSTIRKQSIISSALVYFGFALGFINIYLFTRENGALTDEQYGVTGIFIASSNIIFAIASFGMPAYISKFYPYYKSHLSVKQNDLMTWALLIPLLGFIMIIGLGILLKGPLVDTTYKNSPEFLEYYYWIFPFGLGFTYFMIMESFAWQERKAIFSTFLKEVAFRIFTTLLIAATIFGLIRNFALFIRIYSVLYLALAAILFLYFYLKNRIRFTLTPSKVTRRFKKKILTLILFVWGGGLVFHIANVFDSIIIGAVIPNGMAGVAIFSLAQNIGSLIQAPQRGVLSAAVGPLSQAWKDKDLLRIDRIYHQSSINLLIFSCAMFALIWLNFEDGVHTFNLRPVYLEAKYIFLFIGLARIIDLGTGVNAQIIATSTFWRFEFLSGMLLLACSLPLNYFLTREMGLIGPAISNLIAFTIYNGIRYYFLWNKFKMQPFTAKSLYTIVLTGFCYIICYWLFNSQSGLLWIILRSSVFVGLFGTGMLLLKLSPDVTTIFQTVSKKLRLRKES